MQMPNAGTLYLVPTPIGNLEDITPRALRILGDVDLIACEDTRHTGLLLKRLNIKKRLISYHEHNESMRAQKLVDYIKSGLSVAVVSDAGSPGISDPGYRIVRAAIENDINIVPLPGANSITPAVTASGIPSDRFFFEGYLSHKSAARKKRLEHLKEFPHTLVFFESPHRIVKSLNDILETLGDRPACVAREISKLYEEFIRGNMSSIIDKLSGTKVKGEIVIVVSGKQRDKKSTE